MKLPRLLTLLLFLTISQITYSQCIPTEFQDIQNPDSTQIEEMRNWLLGYDTYIDDAEICLDSIIVPFLAQRNLLELQALANYQLGWVYYEKNQFQLAITKFLTAQDDAEASGYTRVQIASIAEIASTYNDIKQHDQALKFQDRAIAIAKEHPDKYKKIGVLYQNKGRIYEGIGQYKEAIKWYQKGLPFIQKRGDFDVEIKVKINIGNAYLNLDDKKKYKEYVSITDAELEKINNPTTKIEALAHRSNVSLQFSAYEAAIRSAHQAITLSKKNNIDSRLDFLYRILADSFQKSGNLDSAFYYLKLSNEIENTTKEAETIRATTEAEQQYQFEKEKAITALENQAKLQQQRYINYGILAALFLLSILAYSIYINYRNNKKSLAIITAEKQKSDELLLNILPVAAANELKQHGQVAPKFYENATILFSDFEGFSQIAKQLSAEALVTELDTIFKGFDAIVQEVGVEKIKTIGDAYMCAAGIADIKESPDQHALKCVNVGLKMQQFIEDYKSPHQIQWRMRLGIHTGAVTAGIVGVKKFAYDIWGDSVNISSRMESSGIPGKVNISASTYELVKEHHQCSSRGKIEAKNIGEIEMFLVDEAS